MRKCFIALLILACVSFAGWQYDMLQVRVPAAGMEIDNISFGISSDATDSYDFGIDIAPPPPPPVADPAVYILYDNPLYDRLWRYMRSIPEDGDSVVWSFIIDPFPSAATIEWPDLPGHGEFYIASYPVGSEFDWTRVSDMRRDGSMGLMPGNAFSILYIHRGTEEDTDPPVVINMSPENGATGVPSDTDISLEIVDYGSGVDISTLSIMVMGFDIMMLVRPEPIEHGYRIAYSPPLELPVGTFLAEISVCDLASPANCLVDFEYSFTITESDTSYFMIQGSILDPSGAPVEGATVDAVGEGVAIITDSTGLYLLAMPGPGTYEVYAYKDGYWPSDTVPVTITIMAPYITEIDLILEPRIGNRIYGIFELQGEDDHSGIAINLSGTYFDTTDATGRYEIRNIPDGEYTLIATPPDERFLYHHVSLSIFEDVELNGTLLIDDAVKEDIAVIPHHLDIISLMPNPFNAALSVEYIITEPGAVSLYVIDVFGRSVAQLVSGYHDTGKHEIVWRPHDVESGVYTVVLETETEVLTKRALFVK